MGITVFAFKRFFVFIFWASVVYFFSDVHYSGKESMYQYIRIGKNKWGYIQLFQIVLNSLIIVLCFLFLSVLILWKDTKIISDWGEIYYTIAMTDSFEQYNLLFRVPYKIIAHYTVLQAMIFTLIILFLSVTFVGITMFCLSLYFSNTVSIFIGEIFAMAPLITDNISKKYNEVIFFSPTSWVGIINIGYDYNIGKPSIQYIIAVLCIGIIIMESLSLFKIYKDGIYK